MKILLKNLFISLLFPLAVTLCACSQLEVDIEDSIEENKRNEGNERSEIDYPIEEDTIVSDENGWDIPANEGIRNALLNAEQLVNLKYSPLAAFNVPNGKVEAGTPITGLVYSSTRAEDLFCPNNVSLWTFMSSLKNPNSYLYTVDITEPPYSIKGYARGYYGQVCTQFVQYSLGIKYNYQIHQSTVWNGFERVDPQDVERLRLGDVLTTEKGHTRLVTGIRRESGHITEVAISEGTSPFAKRSIYPVKDIVDSFKEGYVFYRYRFINNTTHTPSPFVSVGDEPQIDHNDLLVDEVVPRRGDKANWRKDERVVLDVLERGDYTDYILFKGDIPIRREKIPDNDIIDFGVMSYGDYKLCLSNDEEDGRFVYWIVADYSITAKVIGHKKVRVSFSSKNSTPIWVTWRRPATLNTNNNDMPLWTTIITDKDKRSGYVDSELDSYIANQCGLGEWDFKVAFETEYGILTSDSETVYVY